MCEHFKRSRDEVVAKMFECEESAKSFVPYNKGVNAALEWILGYEDELSIIDPRDLVNLDFDEESSDSENEDVRLR